MFIKKNHFSLRSIWINPSNNEEPWEIFPESRKETEKKREEEINLTIFWLVNLISTTVTCRHALEFIFLMTWLCRRRLIAIILFLISNENLVHFFFPHSQFVTNRSASLKVLSTVAAPKTMMSLYLQRCHIE